MSFLGCNPAVHPALDNTIAKGICLRAYLVMEPPDRVFQCQNNQVHKYLSKVE